MRGPVRSRETFDSNSTSRFDESEVLKIHKAIETSYSCSSVAFLHSKMLSFVEGPLNSTVQ